MTQAKKSLAWFAIPPVACILVFYVLVRLFTPSGGGVGSGGNEAQALQPELKALEAAAKLEESIHQERRAIAVAKQLSLRSAGAQAIRLVDELMAEVNHWEEKIKPLASNDEGRRLATKPEYALAYKKLYVNQHTTSFEVDQHRSVIETLLAPVEAAASDPNSVYVPGDEVSETLAAETAEIRRELDSIRKDRSQVEAMLASVPEDARSELTLEYAILDFEKSQRANEAAAIGRAEAEARERRSEALAAARERQLDQETQDELALIEQETRNKQAAAELERQRLEAEAAKSEAEAEVQRQLNEATRKRAEEQARMKVLRAKAEDEAVQKKFLPFLAKGRYNFLAGNPRGYSSKPWHEFPQPASYSNIKQAGGLVNAKAFAEIGAGRTSRSQFNDRPMWAYPATAEELEEYGELLKEFEDLAPIWIEMGLLKP